MSPFWVFALTLRWFVQNPNEPSDLGTLRREELLKLINFSIMLYQFFYDSFDHLGKDFALHPKSIFMI